MSTPKEDSEANGIECPPARHALSAELLSDYRTGREQAFQEGLSVLDTGTGSAFHRQGI